MASTAANGATYCHIDLNWKSWVHIPITPLRMTNRCGLRAWGKILDSHSGVRSPTAAIARDHQHQLRLSSLSDRPNKSTRTDEHFQCIHCDMSLKTNDNMNQRVRTAQGSPSPGYYSHTNSIGGIGSGDANERPLFNGSSSSTIANDAYNETKKRLGKRQRSNDSDNSKKQGQREDPMKVDAEKKKRDKVPTSNGGNLHSRNNGPGASPTRNAVVGFSNLFHLDLTLKKFPLIPQRTCERTLHRPVPGAIINNLCSKCPRAFPCQSALDGHEINCGIAATATTHDNNTCSDLIGTGKEHFFAMLGLQRLSANVATSTSSIVEKHNHDNHQGDLTDIQNITMNMTGHTSNRLQLHEKAEMPDNCSVGQQGSSEAWGSSSTSQSSNREEDDQNAIASEIREMKLKGEYSCRLCTRAFTNSRALKGHNRIHVNTIPGKPFPCNICKHNCVTKNALKEHMRSHNGPRPYQCSICNYLFTTKSNCERHVRNVHGKRSHEVNSVLIYCPSEDSANNQVDSMTASSQSPRVADNDSWYEILKVLEYQSDVYDQSQQIQQPVLVTGVPLAKYLPHDDFQRPPGIQRHFNHTNRINELLQHQSDQPNDDDFNNSYATDSLLLVERDSGSSPLSDDGSVEPLDLTVDLTVLDLSKKSSSNATKWQENCSREASVEIEDNNTTTTSNTKHRHEGNIDNSCKQQQQRKMLLAQAYMEANHMTVHPTTLESLNPRASIGFPNASCLMLPFGRLFDSHHYHQLFAGNALDMTIEGPLCREPVLGLHTCEGGLVVQKRKQRRYRNERSFKCEHCGQGFTLRSSMKRHVKKQHLQYLTL
ncbi:uncharacterized protein LOC111643071 [Copidosoma floridanum]|uniref:uncharacterized protein LOC111643071 n=1 Tax=Copidosoma floridanum TaxID=29053 RepID=UPI000C6FAFCF|nr:uncharacterized protein LOC111643071 [Copidosoma floridanum]